MPSFSEWVAVAGLILACLTVVVTWWGHFRNRSDLREMEALSTVLSGHAISSSLRSKLEMRLQSVTKAYLRRMTRLDTPNLRAIVRSYFISGYLIVAATVIAAILGWLTPEQANLIGAAAVGLFVAGIAHLVRSYLRFRKDEAPD
jgi:hypothetical protein